MAGTVLWNHRLTWYLHDTYMILMDSNELETWELYKGVAWRQRRSVRTLLLIQNWFARGKIDWENRLGKYGKYGWFITDSPLETCWNLRKFRVRHGYRTQARAYAQKPCHHHSGLGDGETPLFSYVFSYALISDVLRSPVIPRAPRRKGRCTNSALANSSPRERRSSDQSLAPGALEQTCGATISSYGVDLMVF